MAIPKVNLSDVPVKILCINASPRGKSNSQWLLDEAKKGALSLGNVEIEEFRFKGKKIAPCMGCVEYCGKFKKCVHEDEFQTLAEMWLRADGIIWATPVYTFGPPSQVRSWMDRFGEIFFQNMRDHLPLHRFAKPTGVIVQGSSRFGGQEITAQNMMEHIVTMDCIPVSGDMPHADQAVLAQVIDKTTPEGDTHLLHDCFRMGVRVVEMTKLVKLGKLALASSLPDVYWPSKTKLGVVERPTTENLSQQEAQFVDLLKMEDVKINVLAINGSPRPVKHSHSYYLLEEAKKGVQEIDGVEISEYTFGRKELDPCRMGITYCSAHEECVILDDFQEFRSKWLKADGIVWSVPIYHMGPPSLVRAALDRMNELRFQTSRAHDQNQYPRLMKAGGAIINGGSRYGGQEITQQFFLHHFLLLQCVPVTADMPEAYLGVGIQFRNMEELKADEETQKQCRSQGRRVTEMAKIIKAAMMLAQDTLPDEYFPSQEKMGLIERRVLA